MGDILRFDSTRRTNARLITDVRDLGYLNEKSTVLDPTYGEGGFWKDWCPDRLTATDLNPALAPNGIEDFRALTFDDESFEVVVFDPPYKLNGTASDWGGMDERYGVNDNVPVGARMELIYAGLDECARVAARYLMVKCQDQVCSGRVVWQSSLVVNHVEQVWPFDLVDRLEVFGYRVQPPGRRQLHARQSTSSLLIFERGYRP